MADDPFVWGGRCVRVVDGDTLEVELSTGFHTVHTERLRIRGIDAPEVHGDTKPAGDAATAFTRTWLLAAPATSWPLTVATYKTDSFGRYLADVSYVDRDGVRHDLATDLIAQAHAVPYRP